MADLIAIGYDDMTTAEQALEQQVREALQPGTSALFMIVEQMTGDKALEALAPFGGTVIKTSLSKDVEEELQRELHGEAGA